MQKIKINIGKGRMYGGKKYRENEEREENVVSQLTKEKRLEDRKGLKVECSVRKKEKRREEEKDMINRWKR